MSKSFLPLAAALLMTVSSQAFAGPYDDSPQDVLIGADQVGPSANYGAGVKFGDIDTGIVPWLGFTPAYNGYGVNNVDSTNSGKCLNGSCWRAYPTDQNGHGTFTASEIVGAVQSIGMQGVAPAGSVVAWQVLNANGSGSSSDIYGGIWCAYYYGAQVLNLSLGPDGGTGGAAFYQSLANIINAVTSKGVYVVFAGGNSSLPFVGGATITGFSDTAIQHMIFMGSTNANKQLSWFSNTPGTGGFLSKSGKFYPYQSLWMMADGENIIGASNYSSPQTGYNYITQASGTSMAAPQATGAIGLLLARWPVLKTNGMAATILEQSGTDLGAAGTDATYGQGFINLVQAFQAAGTLTATTATGTSIPVSGVSTSVVTGGALGSMAGVASHLKDYTVFDKYQRDYSMDLSGLVATRRSTSPVTLGMSAPKVSTSGTHFADGSSLAFGSTEQQDAIQHPAGDVSGNNNWFASFADASGAVVAAGYGFPASASFADALWGSGSAMSSEVSSLDMSGPLASLAEGGAFTAIGAPVGNMRLAFGWSQTAAASGMNSSDWSMPNANAVTAGLSTDVTSRWKAGVTFGLLNEQSGLLGTTYAASGPLSLGNDNRSLSVGVSSAVALGNGLDLLLDAAVARSDSAGFSGGIISGVTPLYARSFGGALVQHDAFDQGDRLSVSIKSPLRVYAGSASIATTSVDGNGVATTANQKVGLGPSGAETDFAVGYESPVRNQMQWNVSLEARHDADNIAGASDLAGMAGVTLSF
jgi:hypothetical protein